LFMKIFRKNFFIFGKNPISVLPSFFKKGIKTSV